MNTPILILAAIAACAALYPLHRWLTRRSRKTLDIIDSFLSSLLIYGGLTLAVYRDHFGWLGGGMALSFAVHYYFRWLKSAARNP